MSIVPLRPLRRLVVVALVAGAACDSTPDAIGPADVPEPSFAKGGPNQPPSSGGRIVFGSFLTGNYDIFSVNPDGSDLRRLTYGPEHELWPAVSPDGKKIAYLKQRSGVSKSDLWIMNADGGRQQLRVAVPDGVFSFYPPTWSPDGRTITYGYIEDAAPSEPRLASVGARSGSPVTLGAAGLHPSWSPDGESLSYVKRVAGENQLFTSRPDGSDLVQRVDFDSCCGLPQWSPDGNRILFVGAGGSQVTARLYTAYVEGATPWSLLAGGVTPLFAAWSADAAKIAVADPVGDLWVTLANGAGAVLILDGAQAVAGVSWSR